LDDGSLVYVPNDIPSLVREVGKKKEEKKEKKEQEFEEKETNDKKRQKTSK
jgi:hypothetical protein